ncbi:MAG TPA: histidinol-phosphate transaminase [Candidatus Koribacter sp.]|jgi:histidinol-phosphate aminotransferase
MKYEEMVPAHIRALGPYVPGKPLRQAEEETGIKCTKMASNENPFGPSPRALEAMQHALREVHLYPENGAPELATKIAENEGVTPDHILVTGGSTPCLDMIGRTLLVPGQNAVTSERTFIVYPIVTRAAGATLKFVPTKNDGFDLDGILTAIDENTRVVFLANPNNPTGTMFTAQELDRYLERVPDHVVTVIDEAYYDFAKHLAAQRGVEYSHSVRYVKEGRKVLVLRTFSKTHGLAGVRVGFGIGDPELMSYLSRVRTAFQTTSIGEAAAIAALHDDEHLRRTVENNASGAAYLEKGMRDLGLHPVPTWANFVFFEVEDDAPGIAKALEHSGVIVRPLGGWGIPKGLRVTIGNPQQNENFLHALQKVLSKEPVR